MTGFIHGIILSMGLILPLGVQNLFVFNQGAMQKTFFRVIPVVITAGLCDTLLILLAVYGVSLLVLESSLSKTIFIGAGVLFMLFMGWKIWRKTVVASDMQAVTALSTKQQIGFAVMVSLLNPHAIIDTVGVIGTSSINYNGMDKTLFTLACIMISWIWFSCLAIIGRMIGRRNQSTKILCGINKFSAAFMWSTAVYLVYSSF